MIRQITDNKLARDFLNSVPFDDYVPEGMEVCNDQTIILGWYDLGLVCCFPCNKHEDNIEIHCACVELYRGKMAINAAHKAFEWIFSNTHYKTIRAMTDHPHVSRFALMCGMKRNNGIFEVQKWADS